jgi:8-oxo-dGTP pyrophosphatase MutT (NUDIX family)
VTDRVSLIADLKRYSTSFSQEKKFIPLFLELLTHPHAFQRSHLPGHMTGSAWIVDPTGKYALFTHHAKLNRWLQPGGHADGDENIVRVANREANEETGIQNLELISSLFDIDIHSIPARQDFPTHDHYDIRCLFTADKNVKLEITDESHDLAWIALEDVGNIVNESESIMRMVAKTRQLF